MKLWVFIFFSALLAGWPGSGKCQSFLNGNFDITSAVGDQINLDNASFNAMMPNNFAFGTWSGIGDMDIITSATYGPGPQSGSWYVALTSGGTDRITMRLSAPLVVGTSYAMTFYDNFWSVIVPEQVRVGVSTVNNSIGTNVYMAPMPVSGSWSLRSFNFVAPVAGSYISVELNGAPSGGVWTKVDNFAMGVPLPAESIQLSADLLNDAHTIKVNGTVVFGEKLNTCWLERAVAEDDFVPIKEIGRAAGEAAEVKFSMEDELLSSNLQSYRLKLIDNDGGVQYSERLVVDARLSDPEMIVYPNPSEGPVSLFYKHPAVEQEVFAEVYDLQGVKVFSQRMDAVAVSHQLDLSGLNTGLYILQVQAGAGRQYAKVMLR